MKLAVSSFAWAAAEDEAARALLTRHAVRAIELAPLKVWPGHDVPAATLAQYRAEWEGAGISIVALQGILFGFPQLQLFGSGEQSAALVDFLAGMARLAAALGAGVIVLGAPKNRLRGPLSEDEAVERAVGPLRQVAAVADGVGVTVCIEPNPPAYGGDFVCDIAGALRIVDAVDAPGFGLHLDAGAIALEHEADVVVTAAARRARHFHVSEVGLVPIGAGTVEHERIAGLLRRAQYDRWCSIEMLDRGLSALDQAIVTTKAAYQIT